MCFLDENFAKRILEKYMEVLFYDEFLSRLVFLDTDGTEKKETNAMRTFIQNIYHTVYLPKQELRWLKEREVVLQAEKRRESAVHERVLEKKHEKKEGKVPEAAKTSMQAEETDRKDIGEEIDVETNLLLKEPLIVCYMMKP